MIIWHWLPASIRTTLDVIGTSLLVTVPMIIVRVLIGV